MNTKLSFFLFIFFVSITYLGKAQMDINGQILYGNEWIDYSQDYYKIMLEEDGIYRLSYQDLTSAGILSGSNAPLGSEFKLYHLGKEVPIYVSTLNAFTNSDYIEFYGLKNTGEIDVHLYENASHQLNPKYSLFTNVSSYYLTWNSSASSNYQDIANDLSGGLSPEPYCLYTTDIVYSNALDKGLDYGSAEYRCAYDVGEGYGRNSFSDDQDFNITLSDVYSSGPNTNFSTRLFSKSGQHDITIEINNNVITNDNYSGWEVKQFDVSIPTNTLNSGTNSIEITGTGSASNDKFRVSTLSFEYPRMLDFSNQESVRFKLPVSSSKQYLQITDFNHSGTAPVLYDITNKLRIETQLNGSTVEVTLPTSTSQREVVLVSQNAVLSPLSINERAFTDYDFSNSDDYDYIMLTHPYFLDDGNGNNIVQEYANYRASIQGGEYTPIIVDVTQLYDQFGYGIDRHEQAIKNFLKLASDNWDSKLLYIIGKGATYELMKSNPNEWQQFAFVPSFGFPSSDHLFVTPIGSSSPSMGVGRIAVKNHYQLQLYFDKIQEHEAALLGTNQTIEDKSWMKKILHFGGGDENIQNTIESRLNILKDTIENSQLGGEVTSFFKNSSNTVDDVPLEQVVPLINEGALMLTFFGHSAPSTLDFNLGDPNQYQNAGKYPLFYAIGCNTNRVLETESTLSEDFVFIEDKGCIGFLGATWVTALGALSQYAEYFYANMGNDNYGSTVGEIIKATIDDYSFSNSYTAELLRNAIVLHGDPAIRLNPFETPDYLVNKEESVVSPSIINIVEDSFLLDLAIANLGRATNDSIDVKIEHELPNGDMINLGLERIPGPYFQETFNYNYPLDDNAIGLNYLNVTVDENDDVNELPSLAETNNSERIPFFVVSNDIFPIYPYEFSIVPNNDLILKASTANSFSESLSYYFEIDTTELFNSPINESTIVTSSGGVLEWEPNLNMINNTVYYWRVSIDSAAIDGGFNWHNSSFVYIQDNPRGWNQSHYYQQIKDEFTDYVIDADTRAQSFTESLPKTVKVVNAAYPTIGWIEIALFENGFKEITAWPCPGQQEAVLVAVYDSITLERKINPSNGMSQAPNCWDVPLGWYIFYSNTEAERSKIINTLENEIEDNEYVVLYTVQKTNTDVGATQWAADSINLGTNLFQVLESQGAEIVRDIAVNETPYIFIYQKNNPNFTPLEVHATSVSDIIEAEFTMFGINVRGGITSTTIGPASEWETLLWQVSEYDVSTENVNVDVLGIDMNGNETVLLDSVGIFTQTLSSIDAGMYPYIKLIYNSTDTISNTTPQLDYWRVHYTPIPEAALAPNKIFSFQSDTLQQGETLTMEIGIENLGGVDMDSLLMNYTIIDAQNNQVVESDRLKPLLVDDIITGQLTVDTRNLLGENQLIIEANPNNDQPELHHYNNIGVQSFFVQGDDRNPLLDVTFDGIHIMDGDLISSAPEIVITLLDENPFLALTDTSLLRVFVTDPLGQTQEYEVDGDILTFYPATGNISEENKARMEFRPDLLIDGTYELQVRGKDESGNNSGDFDFKVNFEVINEETVSNVLNYPNPFSTSTQFVFTLTGNELPDVFRIQIMTVSGKIVKEIDMAELGPIHIGNNISDYRWDGTDEYGDKLANGVYLYRVMVKKDGEAYEAYDNGTNEFFKKGFGKMVILR